MNSLQTTSVLAVLAIIVVLSAHIGEAKICFECISGKDYQGDACLNLKNTDRPELEKGLVTDCDKKNDGKNYTRCRTMVQDLDGDVRLVRSCATWPEPKKENRCIDRTGTFKIKIHYCECEGDYCNSASALSVSIVAILLAALFGHANV